MNIERILSETFIKAVDQRRKCTSTNILATAMLVRGRSKLPLLVFAERQTGGRGRGKKRWWSADGALTFSVVVDEATVGIRAGRDSRVAIAAGLAVAETLRPPVDDSAVTLKWPNDVLIDDRKVGGILVEVDGFRPDAAVIGIGLNVNNSIELAPEEIQGCATSLVDVTGREHDREELLISLLRKLDEQLRLLSSPAADLPRRWDSWCALTGRLVKVRDGEREIAGKCHGIDVAGALLLQKRTTLHRVVAGSVIEIEP